MRSLSFRLPWPPSVNHYYGRRHQGGVYLKEAGRLFRRHAAAEFSRLGWPRLSGNVRVTLLLAPPDRRTRDIDNIRKAVYDAISDRKKRAAVIHHGVIADDKFIVEDEAQFVDAEESFVHITITELEKNQS
jgi:Holliday junction resolvase